MLAVLREKLRDRPGTIRDDSITTTWRELIARVENVGAAEAIKFHTPENRIDDVIEILVGACGLRAVVLLNTRETEVQREGLAREFGAFCVQPGLYVATSGSQGQPKLVFLSPDALWNQAQVVNEHLQAGEHDTWLACLPLYHVGGMAILLRAALVGSSLRLTSEMSALHLANVINEEPITLVSFVPTLLRRVITANAERAFPVRFRAILVGGGPIESELIAQVPQALRSYGMTETGSMVTCVSLHADAQERMSEGKPLRGAAIKIIDDNQTEVETGIIGRILVNSTGMTSGYVNDPEQTALVFREGWIHTDDIGFVDADGNLHVLGRRDRIVISGGENVALDEVESAIRELPGVRDAICCGLNDAEWGQIIGAVIETDQDYSNAEILSMLRERLPSFKLPRKILLVRHLPQLPSGKPDYQTALKLFALNPEGNVARGRHENPRGSE